MEQKLLMKMNENKYKFGSGAEQLAYLDGFMAALELLKNIENETNI